MAALRPLAIDLFCGLGGWSEGLIAAGWHVIGFDIEDMRRRLGEPHLADHHSLVIQDVLTLHGSQFRDAELIVGSSPCQEFSYRAMPWKRAKALGPPELGMALFHAQFRIQREASEAAGRPIPLVVENVRGAQPWVGRARANFGSYYLWGDLPALMPIAAPRKWNEGSGRKVPGFRFDGSGRSFQTAAVAEGRKGAGAGAAWFDANLCQLSSRSPARVAAAAKIAKIPFTLAHWIGSVWLPSEWRAPTRQGNAYRSLRMTKNEAA